MDHTTEKIQTIIISDKKCEKKYSERQGHGFKYEDEFIKKYNLIKSYNYIAKFDGHCEFPVQIKYMQARNEICLSSFKNNIDIKDDFILHIAFYKEKNELPNIEDYTLYIKHEIYTNLFKVYDFDKIQKELSLISNNKSDNAKFKSFRLLYKNSDNIIQIRFKRDHKKQIRIQAGLPYSKLQDFIKLFNPYKFKNNNIDNTDKMYFTQNDRKKLEKFYTKPIIVKLCMENVILALDKLNIIKPHILEPSAGSGVFINEFNEFTYDAYDIHPESLVSEKKIIIKKDDFLKKNTNEIITNTLLKPLVVVGNPPYKLAIKFINKCAELNAVLICFVLPNVFKKPTIFNKIDRFYHLMEQITLPKNSFELGSVDYDVPSSFFILVKKDILRPLIKLDKPCVGYKYISFNQLKIENGIIKGADISILRVGGRAGRAFLTNDISNDALVSKQKYNYFIKLSNITDFNFSEKPEELINKINEIEWEKNNTTGPRSIGKYELNPILNKIFNCEN